LRNESFYIGGGSVANVHYGCSPLLWCGGYYKSLTELSVSVS